MTKSMILTCAILVALLVAFLSHDIPAVEAKSKGQVKINVWRGPTKGHKKHKFAPWGYHAKLPADEGKKKHG